jgi:hypothetical protein
VRSLLSTAIERSPHFQRGFLAMFGRFAQRAVQLFAHSRGFTDALTRSIANVSAFKTE